MSRFAAARYCTQLTIQLVNQSAMKKQNPRFLDKIVIVTGASSGIGAATASAFAAEGARVALTAPESEMPTLQALAEELRHIGRTCLAFPVDVTETAQIEAMVRQVLQNWGRIDVLVNNAGVGYHGPFESMSLGDFEKVLQINLLGAVRCLYATIPVMLSQRGGQIINIASAHSRRAHPYYAAYAASKYALRGLSDSLRVELAPHGIAVLTYCPPYTESKFFDNLLRSVGPVRPRRTGATPAAVANGIVEAAWRRKREVVVTFRERLLDGANRFTPSLVDCLIARHYEAKLGNRGQSRLKKPLPRTTRFQGQVVIVTGASRGIGRSVAMAFGMAGARVALVARSADVIHALAQGMQQRGQESLAASCDIADPQQVAGMVAAVMERWGRIDILVNNAGIGAHGQFSQTPYNDFERIFRVNLFGVAYCISAVLPHMIRERSGKIVNVSSMIGKRAYPGNAAYCASKFALQGLAESLRVETRHHGIRVIQVCPDVTETTFFDHLLHSDGRAKPSRPGMSPDKVAALLLEAAHRNRREIVIGVRAKIFVLFDKLLPGLLDWLLQRRYRHGNVTAGPARVGWSEAAEIRPVSSRGTQLGQVDGEHSAGSLLRNRSRD